jgi:hypothetical protein
MLAQPKYSMTSRRPAPESTRSPGPAAYLPGKWAVPHRPPAYTFGLKRRDETAHVTPGLCITSLGINFLLFNAFDACINP